MIDSYADKLWGDIELSPPVLAELTRSEPLQRLRGIHQAGAGYYLLPDIRNTTRFEHSLGVMYVLTRLGAGLEERIAGLLHDIPHTAFSHTADILFPNDEHTFHERFQHDMVVRSSIPAILERHGVPLVAALEPDSFPLLEQPLPALCADRLDYSLRDAHTMGLVTREQAAEFLDHLRPAPAGPVVDNAGLAYWYARLFLETNNRVWATIDEAGAYWALAGAMRRGYELGEFSDIDLFATDEAAMNRLRSIEDDTVRAYLRLLTPGTHFHPVGENEMGFVTHMKHRAVDPWVQEPGWDTPRRLSQIEPEYAREVDNGALRLRTDYRLWSDGIDPLLAAGPVAAQG